MAESKLGRFCIVFAWAAFGWMVLCQMASLVLLSVWNMTNPTIRILGVDIYYEALMQVFSKIWYGLVFALISCFVLLMILPENTQDAAGRWNGIRHTPQVRLFSSIVLSIVLGTVGLVLLVNISDPDLPLGIMGLLHAVLILALDFLLVIVTLKSNRNTEAA